jgi:hypothetical protein
MTIAVGQSNENNTVWFTTRVLKYFHPSAFHCYFAGKETYTSFRKYLTETSWKDIMYNLVYKTGLMFDQIRVINRLYNKEQVEDRDVYVVARSIG